ncbi:hypothetical protein A3H22_04460 [Candidatus Peribacteria bacterium RIFCSPLOWO2_12_FULL_55_15]|nr:MAG: hypothetical protein A2789_01875 [Candidatus Peribacteria bacterium RIFCSPHIGHO2_01_FULL_54_22]OGJ62314.1 MAG: hypothetical protein A3D12_02135 [Candidatus Peribacteria bacterium RIFCSPHIGHO2_02_FULL_55_24]OGJ64921.1 MAG: hypothetical protein A3E47_03410 [Candidatus Peribacteria bacterium RIFCSPHIGHO2_12_FULL_54_10]OGJ67731.1 MAG: hypothetical protein A2947_03380 [Candidatus Peribacteria bacterium RIFCSPLOWO2_01_FULL_54_110]OGJ71073.1 MAG: hypothetical protein A3H22_04460 [Candidatus Pe
MGGWYPQAFFSTPGMVSVFVVVMLAELLSLGFLWLASYEFRQMMHRHALFFRAIGGNGQHERVERTSHIIFWIYVIFTLITTALTTFFFVFQLHIL